MNRIQPDNVHSNIFTPREYQVELLWRCLQQNTVSVLASSCTKIFLATCLCKELHYLAALSHQHKRCTDGSSNRKLRAVFVSSSYGCLCLMSESVRLNTSLTVNVLPQTVEEVQDWDEDRWQQEFDKSQVVMVSSAVASRYVQRLLLRGMCLLFLADAQLCLTDNNIRELVRTVPEGCRVVGCTPPLLPPNSDVGSPHVMHCFLRRLRQATGCHVTTASEIVAVIGNENRPSEHVAVCSMPCESLRSLGEHEVRRLLAHARRFLDNHRYDPVEVYGEEYREFCTGVPDPKKQPLALLDNIETVLNELGMWCCDRAALYSLVEIEKLKKKTAYDRHYLLLCMIFTVMTRIRIVTEENFEAYSDLDQILNFSSPKVLRLIAILRRIRPLHFIDPRNRNRGNSEDRKNILAVTQNNCESYSCGKTVDAESLVGTMDSCASVIVNNSGSSASIEGGGNKNTCVVETILENYVLDHVVKDATVTEVNDEDIVRLSKQGWFGNPPDEVNSENSAANIEDNINVSKFRSGEDSFDKVCSIAATHVHNNCDNRNEIKSALHKPERFKCVDDADLESVDSYQSCMDRIEELVLDDDMPRAIADVSDVQKCNYVQSNSDLIVNKASNALTNGKLCNGGCFCLSCTYTGQCVSQGCEPFITSRIRNTSAKKDSGTSTPDNFSSCTASPIKCKNSIKVDIPVCTLTQLECSTARVSQHKTERCGDTDIDGTCDPIMAVSCSSDSEIKRGASFSMTCSCVLGCKAAKNNLICENNSSACAANCFDINSSATNSDSSSSDISSEPNQDVASAGGSDTPTAVNSHFDLPTTSSSDVPENANTMTPSVHACNDSVSALTAAATVDCRGYPSAQFQQRGGKKRRGDAEVKEKVKVHNPDDPDSVCGLIFVRSATTAKMVYRLLKELSDIGGDFAWIFPQYTVEINANDRLSDGASQVDEKIFESELKKQEEVLRRFRHMECNLLVATKVLEEGIDVPHCTLVVRFDPASSFQSYVQSAGRARPSRTSHYFHLVDAATAPALVHDMATYAAFAKVLLENSSKRDGDSIMLSVDPTLRQDSDIQDKVESPLKENVASLFSEVPSADACSPYVTPTGTTLSLPVAMQLLNKYCAKLPSDTFTRLTVQWQLHRRRCDDGRGYLYCCSLALPINSPLKDVIVGPWQPRPCLAQHCAAFTTCVALHQLHELDDQLQPVGKESIPLDQHLCPPPPADRNPDAFPRPGTTKRRQYYYKRVAACLTGGEGRIKEREELEEETVLYLYSIFMVLRCAIPDQQNTRGRRIYRPELSPRDFGILTTHIIPQTSAFPVFTRSGEVMVTLTRVTTSRECPSLRLSEGQLADLNIFHQFTFTHVLRLEKYPIKFAPLKANASFFVVPLISAETCNGGIDRTIDWQFVMSIRDVRQLKPTPPSDDKRASFSFSRQRYEDAVVMPWYRNHDQPQYFYVAEICEHLTPQSDFPDAGFETFEKYYLTKYGLQVCNLQQPLLDVDHTSARLNLLTPRHVNRKGVALPTTSEETKRAKRENLQQKQILVPELCSIHPFPASLWRKAVCLPTILYRVNSLLLADELRVKVAREIGLGKPVLPPDLIWPALDFGWTLADVFKKCHEDEEAAKKNIQNGGQPVTTGTDASKEPVSRIGNNEELPLSSDTETQNKRDGRNGELEIGTWSNEMAFEQQQQDMAEDLGDDELDEMDIFDPNEELPDNLTILDGVGIVDDVEGELGSDWGTGLKERKAKSKISAQTYRKKSGGVASKVGTTQSVEISCGGGMFRVGSPSNFECDDAYDFNGDGCKSDNYAGSDVYDEMGGFDDDDEFDDYWDEYEAYSEAESTTDETKHNASNDWTSKNKKRSDDLAGEEEEEELNLMMGEIDYHELTSAEDEYRKFILEKEAKILASVNFVPEGKELIFEKAQRLISAEKPQDRTPVASSNDISADAVVCDASVEPSANNALCSAEQSTTQFGLNLEMIDQRDTLENMMKSYTKTKPILYPVGEDRQLFSFDHQPDLSSHCGPSPSIILQALTMSNANDGVNLERLETIGDSYLKFAITTYLYCTYPQQHEGKLSYLRSKQVSNLNLYRLGKYKGLGDCMVATKFEPHDNWLPPSYYVPRELEEALIDSGVPSGHWNMADLPNLHELSSEQIRLLVHERTRVVKMTTGDNCAVSTAATAVSGIVDARNPEELPIFIPYNLLTQHSIPDKSIADSVEALIGAYLTMCGPKGALLFMSWLGIKVLPTKSTFNSVTGEEKITFTQVDVPESPLHVPKIIMPSHLQNISHSELDSNSLNVCNNTINNISSLCESTASSIKSTKESSRPSVALFADCPQLECPISLPSPRNDLDLLLAGYEEFEKTIDYTFLDRSYLLQAFTHASFCRNRLTDCYQRLEFLGDAVLDYLITRHLYEDCRHHSPGALTDLRSALVNNTIFATLAVKHSFHKYFRHFSPGLDAVIREFVREQEANGHKIDEEYYLLEGETEADIAEDIEVPKALGDVFESVAGAIFLDSGCSLDAVWGVYYPVMRGAIDQFTAVVPKSPIRELLEMEPETAKFGRPERLVDGKVRVSVEIFGKGSFCGVGRNYRIAKSTAAKRALRHLRRVQPGVVGAQ